METTFARQLKAAKENLMKKVDIIVDTEPALQTAKLLRLVVLSWFFLHTVLLLPYMREFWSAESYILRPPIVDATWFDTLFRLFNNDAVAAHYRLFIIGQLATLAAGIVGYRVRLMTLLAWFFTLNLGQAAYLAMDGGNNLATLLLTYLLLINTTGRPLSSDRFPTAARIARAVSNTAFFIVRCQVVIVYATAATLKIQGGLWQNGMALYYILQSDSFTHPMLMKLMQTYPWFSMAGTYAALFFQWAFAFLIWNPRLRAVLMLAGVGLHLGIAFGMGLFTFGLMMCLSYVAWFPERWSRAFFSVVALSPSQIRHQVSAYFSTKEEVPCRLA